MYRLRKNGVIRLSDNVNIPDDLKNRDWRKYQAWIAEGNTPDSKNIIDPWIAKRIERNLILQSSDWAVKTDVPLTAGKKNEWKAYRQELRDLPETYPDADDIIWPEQPAPPG